MYMFFIMILILILIFCSEYHYMISEFFNWYLRTNDVYGVYDDSNDDCDDDDCDYVYDDDDYDYDIFTQLYI